MSIGQMVVEKVVIRHDLTAQTAANVLVIEEVELDRLQVAGCFADYKNGFLEKRRALTTSNILRSTLGTASRHQVAVAFHYDFFVHFA